GLLPKPGSGWRLRVGLRLRGIWTLPVEQSDPNNPEVLEMRRPGIEARKIIVMVDDGRAWSAKIKIQHATSKIQRRSKSQGPMNQQASGEVWCLDLDASLDVGC